MTIEAQNYVTNAGTEGQPSSAPAAPAPAPAPAPAAAPQGMSAVPTPAPTAPSAPAAKKSAKLSADDDDIPDDAELVQMSPRALKARLARASKQALREQFGTDDLESIKSKLATADEYAKKQEEERLAKLTAEQKLKEERDKAIRERDEFRTKFEERERTYVIEKQDARITRIAEKHIKPRHVAKFLPDLAQAILSSNDPKLAKNEDAWIEGWFKKLVQEEPEFGVNYAASVAAAQAPAEKPEPKKIVLSNGAKDGRPAGSQTSGAPKTAAPGKPNSMSDKEIRESGYSWK